VGAAVGALVTGAIVGAKDTTGADVGLFVGVVGADVGCAVVGAFVSPLSIWWKHTFDVLFIPGPSLVPTSADPLAQSNCTFFSAAIATFAVSNAAVVVTAAMRSRWQRRPPTHVASQLNPGCDIIQPDLRWRKSTL
jgi:hypothetical protein